MKLLLAALPVVMAGAVMDSQFEGMKTTLLEIARKAEQSGEQINQTTKNVVMLMMSNINETLVNALHVERDAADSSLSAAHAAVEECYTTRSATFAGDVASKSANEVTAEGDFLSCKDAEPVLLQKKDVPPTTLDDPWAAATDGGNPYGYNMTRVWNNESTSDALGHTSHEFHAQAVQSAKCKDLDDYVKNFVVVHDQDAGWCADGDDVFAWFTELKKWQADHAETYKYKREQCHEARHRHQVRIAECHRLQHLFEQAYCNWDSAITTACSNYATCYEQKWAVWNSTKISVTDIELQLKEQQKALEHLLCYANQILQDQVNLAECDDLECSKCSDLDIMKPDPHVEVDCDEALPNKPCDSAWCTANYDSLHSSVPVDECIPCA